MVVIVDTKIPNQVIWAPERVVSTTNVEFSWKTGFSMLRIKWHGLQASQIYIFAGHHSHAMPIDCAHNALGMCFLLIHMNGLLRVGKGRYHCPTCTIMQLRWLDAGCLWGMCSCCWSSFRLNACFIPQVRVKHACVTWRGLILSYILSVKR